MKPACCQRLDNSLAFAGDGYGADVGRMVDVDDLVSTKAIGERLGFNGRHTVHYLLRSDETFPEPVYVVPDATRPLRLWYWPDVEAWWSERQARRRRQPPPVESEPRAPANS